MPEITRTSKEQFDRQAAHYDVDWNSWSKETLDWLLNSAEVVATDRVLDVATGAGFTAIEFAKSAAFVTGTDVSTGMLEQSAKNAASAAVDNVVFLEAPAENLPFEASSFDIVACRIAAHHFLDINRFASESYRVLSDAGRLVVADTSVPDDDFLAAVWQNDIERLRDRSHNKNYTVNEWRKILERTGFTILSISDSGTGIRIPLSSWILKAGCTEEQEIEIRERFAQATPNVKRRFNIEVDSIGETWFTWLRVLIKASKPGCVK